MARIAGAMKGPAEELIDRARKAGVEFADVRLSRSRGFSILAQDGRVERVGVGESAGGGVRVFARGRWGFSSCDSLSERALLRALESAVSAARLGPAAEPFEISPPPPTRDAVPARPHKNMPNVEQAAERILAIERAGVAQEGERIVNSTASYAQSEGEAVVANTVGSLVTKEGSRSRLSCSMIASKGKLSQRWSEVRGSRGGWELVEETPDDFGPRTAQRAVSLLSAEPAPSGPFRVIFSPSIAGLLVHECVGHNCEADLVLSGQSILDGKTGERIASPLVTIVDDPTLEAAYGSYRYDAEGVPASPVKIVEGGVLSSFLNNIETASRTGARPDGHGRAQSYHARPLVRMSNTYMSAGESSLDEMIRACERGILLGRGDGGYVLSERGEYTCRARDGVLIERGELTRPLRDIVVNGLLLETLSRIEAVGKDLKLEDPGECYKDGQSVPVDNGGPHVLVSEVVIGGGGA